MTDTQTDPAANLDLFDHEWEQRMTLLRRITNRLLYIMEDIEQAIFYLDRDEDLQVSDLLNIHDDWQAFLSDALSSEFVFDETGEPVTLAMWDDITLPAVGADEVVMTAAEHEAELDTAYRDGLRFAAETTLVEGYELGVDDGINMAARVMRVINARVIDAKALAKD